MQLLNVFFSLSLVKSTLGYTNYCSTKLYNTRMYMSIKKTNHIILSNLYKPKTENQKTYVDSLNNDINKIVVVNGPAGTGKTLFACQKAITLMKMEKINKIIITRPVVTVEEEIGFLPGNLIKKMIRTCVNYIFFMQGFDD
jgi:phosphate starvation-inducible protein PhoH